MTSHGRRRRTADSRRRKVIRIACVLAGLGAVAGGVLVACSTGSGGGAKPSAGAPSSTAAPGKGSGSPGSTTTAAAPVRYGTLPAPCKAVTAGTVSGLVPKARRGAGTEAPTSDPRMRGTCSWTGDGKDGYQYRWLSVSLQRFANDPQLGSAEDQARKRYADQLRELSAVRGFTASALTGFGDQAEHVTGKETLAKVTSQNDTLLARTGNVVVLVEYNGAGLEGRKSPTPAAVRSGAQQAAKDALAALAAATANPA
jgi:hypothetical protein